MDTSGLWQGFGEALDETIFKDQKLKCNIGPGKARILDADLRAAGINVQANPKPIDVPWWAPFAVTALSTFGPPAAVYLAKNIPKWIVKIQEEFKRRTSPGKPQERKEPPPAMGSPIVARPPEDRKP